MARPGSNTIGAPRCRQGAFGVVARRCGLAHGRLALAARPARSTALFTWALGTAVRCSIPWRVAPRTTTGAWPSVVRTSAPIALSGSATRSIGLSDRLSSPSSTVSNGADASSPASSRIVVPEFEQSSARLGGSRPARPFPSSTRSRPRGRGSFVVERSPSAWGRGSEAQPSSAPRACPGTIRARQVAVALTSRASGRPRSSLTPSPVAARINHRWAIDLSPGTRTGTTTGADEPSNAPG